MRFGLIGGVILAAAIVCGLVFAWFFCRIEPPTGTCAILTRLDGKDIPANEIIATSPDQKGIQLDPLSEGRYFRNPVYWHWEIVPLVQIQQSEVGVLVRQFGKTAPAGQFIVKNKEPDGTQSIPTPNTSRNGPR